MTSSLFRARSRSRRVLFATVAVAALALAGCGDDTSADPAGGGDGGLEVEAGDLYFEPEQLTAEAGEIEFTLVNVGGTEHDLVIEEAGDTVVAHAEGGETATGTIELEPGTYTYYCSIPGHRQAMEGTLEVS